MFMMTMHILERKNIIKYSIFCISRELIQKNQVKHYRNLLKSVRLLIHQTNFQKETVYKLMIVLSDTVFLNEFYENYKDN